MAWLARSIANSLRLDEDDEPHYNNSTENSLQIASTDQRLQSDSSSPLNPDRGVKEDLSELTKTLTRQFWGVASFLAPSPPPPPPPPLPHQSSLQQQQRSSPESNSGLDAEDPESSDSTGIAGIRSDFAEIGGRFRIGISKLSNNINVSEITKIASNFLQLGPEGDEYESSGDAVGVTEEVLEFVRDITKHPDTWLDFPMLDDSEENDDDQEFDLSDIQQEHALAVERLAPRLAALRIELCPGYMTEGLFWKIYFVLLHPKLNKHDGDLLSTPQIVKARALLAQEMKSTTNSEVESISNPSVRGYESISLEPSVIIQSHPTETVNNEFETDKHPVQTVETPIVDKSVIIDQNSPQPISSSTIIEKYEDDGDDWLKEEGDSEEVVGPPSIATNIENEEDVSFSDLEEEDDDIPTNYKKEKYGSDSSTKDSRDWVQLSRSSTASGKELDGVKEAVTAGRNSETAKETNDWLDIDEIDMD